MQYSALNLARSNENAVSGQRSQDSLASYLWRQSSSCRKYEYYGIVARPLGSGQTQTTFQQLIIFFFLVHALPCVDETIRRGTITL